MVAHHDVLQARLRPPRRRDSRGGASPHRLGRTSNREGIGARLTVEAGDLTLTREVDGGFAYASASERDPHFGLGDATEVTRLTVRWPSGIEQVLEDVPVNTWLDVVEPDPWRSSASNRPEGRIERQGRAKGAKEAPSGLVCARPGGIVVPFAVRGHV